MADVIGILEVRGDLVVGGDDDSQSRTVSYNNIDQSNQDIADDTETDCLGLTEVAFPSGRHAPDGTKQYWVEAMVNFVKGNNGYIALRLYTGSNGTKADTLRATSWQFIPNNQQGSIVISVVVTPSAGDKLGLAAQSETSGGGTDMSIQAGDTVTFVGGYMHVTRVS
jgi:hypothetical protein